MRVQVKQTRLESAVNKVNSAMETVNDMRREATELVPKLHKTMEDMALYASQVEGLRQNYIKVLCS